jgi:diguanylate cyclase (GGDEF)-like protein
MKSGLIEDDLAVAVIDALTSHICVVDPAGIIVAVNKAWSLFTSHNSTARCRDHIGINYLDVCRRSVGPASEEAPPVLKGLHAVLHGETEFFQIEYPCHSPTEMRWYLARVSPLRRRSSASKKRIIGAVISHVDITNQKLAELEYARLAATDPLTEIPNRRFFHDFAKRDMERFLRFGDPSSLLMVDLDNFKKVNDTYGHAAGDEVLHRIAAAGKATFRKNRDLFARLGGEEFVCMLPGTDEWGAVMAAEKLRATVERLPILSGTQLIPVTVSIGVSSVYETDLTVDDTLRRADRALYRAKCDGRNCVRSDSYGSAGEVWCQDGG